MVTNVRNESRLSMSRNHSTFKTLVITTIHITFQNDDHVGYNCPAQVHAFQTLPSFPQQYPCCEDCGVTHEPYQCQPENHDYFDEQNSCYDSNSFGFDQIQTPQYTINHPIFNVHNDMLTSQTTIMDRMTQLSSMCEMFCQIIQKKQEEKRIEEEQAANAQYWKVPACCDDDDDYDSAITPNEPKQEEKRIEEEQAASARYWKILACCDDDDDYNFAITPVLSTEEPDNTLSMGDEHLNTISATESDEVIKSSVENLVPIQSEFEGIPDTMCDVHLVNNPTILEAKDHFKIVINSNDDISSNDDDSLYKENIEYVEASSHESELVNLEAAEIVIPEEEEIKDDNLREKLLNVHLLIANIEALKDNPTPSSKLLTKSSSTSPKSFLEETNTFHN
nr:hypothetical protein [Tanacetum cinerariifolium]